MVKLNQKLRQYLLFRFGKSLKNCWRVVFYLSRFLHWFWEAFSCKAQNMGLCEHIFCWLSKPFFWWSKLLARNGKENVHTFMFIHSRKNMTDLDPVLTFLFLKKETRSLCIQIYSLRIRLFSLTYFLFLMNGKGEKKFSDY